MFTGKVIRHIVCGLSWLMRSDSQICLAVSQEFEDIDKGGE